MNDEINKLLREKRHWENQIVALGALKKSNGTYSGANGYTMGACQWDLSRWGDGR